MIRLVLIGVWCCWVCLASIMVAAEASFGRASIEEFKPGWYELPLMAATVSSHGRVDSVLIARIGISMDAALGEHPELVSAVGGNAFQTIVASELSKRDFSLRQLDPDDITSRFKGRMNAEFGEAKVREAVVLQLDNVPSSILRQPSATEG